VDLLGDAAERARLGANARRIARERYDLRAVCLPRQLAWFAALVGRSAARNGGAGSGGGGPG